MKTTLIVGVIVVAGLLLAGPVGAQDDDSSTTTVTSPISPTESSVSSSSSVPSSTPTTSSVPGIAGSTTTTLFATTIPPELINDPRSSFLVDPGDGDGGDVPVDQRTFDPRSVEVLPEKVAEAETELSSRLTGLSRVGEVVQDLQMRVDGLVAKAEGLSGATKRAVERAASARKRLRDQAVRAYVSGRSEPKLSILAVTNPGDVDRAAIYLGALVDSQDQLVREYELARKALSKANKSLAADLGVQQSKLVQNQLVLERARLEVLDAAQQLVAYQAGAHAYVSGFVFPVAADVEFIDSWGFPRMTGTSYAHWHQGTDIFAPMGAAVVASEDGVIERLGNATLGGNKLWLSGTSGMSYYYAHLSGFAAGIANGTPVRSGQVLGFVGDTGNAKGTSPHLHFELHPDGGDAVNAYPLLKASYGNRPVIKAVAPTSSTVPAPSEGE